MFNQILPIIFTPLFSVVILLLSASISNSKAALKAAAFILIIFSLGVTSDFLWYLAEKPWKSLPINEVSKGDAIVVLSGSMSFAQNHPSNLTWNSPDRFFAGIKLLKEKIAPKLIFSAGPGYNNSKVLEGKFYLEKSIELGLPEDNIYTTKPVINTQHEAKIIHKLSQNLALKKPTKVILVTSAFHMTRAKNLFEKEGLEVIPYPVNFQNRNINDNFSFDNLSNWIPNARNLASSSKIMRELLATAYYKLLR